MKTIIENETKLSKYIFDDCANVVMTTTNVITPDFIIGDLNSTNATLVERVTPPKDWKGNHYLYNDGIWSWFEYEPEHLKQSIIDFVQKRLDDFARTRNYDSILSACTYATSTAPKFASEGQYCVEARDATWAKLYEVMAEVEAGTRPMPQSYADIEPELPVLAWPV